MSLIPLPAITTRLQAAMAGLLLVLLASLAAGAAGYCYGKHAATVAGDLNMAQYRASVIESHAKAQAKAEREKDLLITRGMALGSQLVAEREQHAQRSTDIKRRITHVTRSAVIAPKTSAAELVQPDAGCRLTVGFVGMYNAAIGADEPANLPAAAGTGGADPQAEPAEATDSGVQPEDILYHLADYGQRCRDMESQLVRLIELREPADGRY